MNHNPIDELSEGQGVCSPRPEEDRPAYNYEDLQEQVEAVRRRVAIALRRAINEEGHTVQQAAKKLELTPDRVRALLCAEARDVTLKEIGKLSFYGANIRVLLHAPAPERVSTASYFANETNNEAA